MVAALDSKSNPARGAGSIPALGTTDRADSRELKNKVLCQNVKDVRIRKHSSFRI